MIRLPTSSPVATDSLAHLADTWRPSNAALTLRKQLPAPPPSDGLSRPVCASEGCRRQPKFWKRTPRPVFEDQWCCSKRCAIEIVQAAMRRQQRRLTSPAEHRHRIPLGLMLLEQGIVTYFQLRQALDAQKSAGHGKIGEWLDELCGVSDMDVVRALARQWNRPVLSATGFDAGQMALILPAALRDELRMVPVRVAAGKILYVAFEGPVDAAAENILASMTGLKVESGLLPDGDVEYVKRSLTHASTPLTLKHLVENEAELTQAIVDTLFRHQPFGTRLVSVRGQWWLRMFLEPAAMSGIGLLPARSEDVLDVLFASNR